MVLGPLKHLCPLLLNFSDQDGMWDQYFTHVYFSLFISDNQDPEGLPQMKFYPWKRNNKVLRLGIIYTKASVIESSFRKADRNFLKKSKVKT